MLIKPDVQRFAKIKVVGLGGGGNDTIVGRSQRNDLSGNGGNDVLISTNGVTVFRTDFVDFIIGRKKNDRLLIG
jgi:Ca2+-binding RTX toxin-like protein